MTDAGWKSQWLIEHDAELEKRLRAEIAAQIRAEANHIDPDATDFWAGLNRAATIAEVYAETTTNETKED